jgi:predicted metal-dependent hydrolase
LDDLRYSIRRSPRARRPSVSVDPERGVEVILPRRARDSDAAAVVAELRPWIEKRLRQHHAAEAAVQGPPGTLPFLGVWLTVVPQPGRTRVHRAGDVLRVPAGDAEAAIERWYRRAARAEIVLRLDAACTVLGVDYTALTIRSQRTRWGSCSSTGAMSFNWRLLLAPEPILDYVVWHEACHLVIADHSPRFWALVARHWPEHRAHARWLRRYGSALTLAAATRAPGAAIAQASHAPAA